MVRKTVIFTLLIVFSIFSTAYAWTEPTYTAPWSETLLDDPPESEPSSPPDEVPGENQDTAAPEEIPIEEELPPIDDFLLDFENLYGTWYIWTPGTATNLYDTTTGDYAGMEYKFGAAQGEVVVNPDGTYTMMHIAWGGDEVIEGTWRLSFPGEINGERLIAIVLLDGLTGCDWAVAPSSNHKIRLLWSMVWADGSKTWVFDAELHR